MDTKNLILSSALDLFSQKGFEGVSVRDIARQVGVRESALYKHFKSKQEILEKLTAKMSQEVLELYKKYQAPEATGADIISGYKKLSEKQLCQMVWNIFSAFTGESQLAKFRRLLIHEQHETKFAEVYNAFFIDGVINNQEKVFSKLIKAGYFKKHNARLMALNFYGPVFFLLQKADNQPDCMEEIKKLLNAHIRNFGQMNRQEL